jgi:phenylacetate-CoA ligase
MPLIRYCNGDLAEVNRESNCPHGQMTFQILGRSEDNLLPLANYPVIPEVTYYRWLPRIDSKKFIGYLSPNSQWVIEPKLKKSLTSIWANEEINYYQFPNALAFYQACLPQGDSNSASRSQAVNDLDSTEQLLTIITSRRWIFSRLPDCLNELVNQMETSENFQLQAQLQPDRLWLFFQILLRKNSDTLREKLGKIWLKYQERPELPLIYLDLLIIGLFSGEQDLVLSLQANPPNQIKIDSLSYRLLLTVISQRIQQSRLQSFPPPITKLTPLLPLFISDLDYCQLYGTKILPSILVHWAIILNCFPDEQLNQFFPRPQELHLREQNLQSKETINCQDDLVNLENLTLLELKELGIKMVLFDLRINPSYFLEVMTLKLGENKQKELSKPLAFVPLMRFLSQRLLAKGERKKAFNCLLMSQDISQMQDDFESSTWLYNFKQKIL